MAGVGSAALTVELLTSLYAVGASLAGAVTGRPELIVSAPRGVYALPDLRTRARLDSLLSREAFFLLNDRALGRGELQADRLPPS